MCKIMCYKINLFDLKGGFLLKKKNISYFFGLQRGLGVEAKRKEVGENKSHFLMLSRRAAVLYCVA